MRFGWNKLSLFVTLVGILLSVSPIAIAYDVKKLSYSIDGPDTSSLPSSFANVLFPPGALPRDGRLYAIRLKVSGIYTKKDLGNNAIVIEATLWDGFKPSNRPLFGGQRDLGKRFGKATATLTLSPSQQVGDTWEADLTFPVGCTTDGRVFNSLDSTEAVYVNELNPTISFAADPDNAWSATTVKCL